MSKVVVARRLVFSPEATPGSTQAEKTPPRGAQAAPEWQREAWRGLAGVLLRVETRLTTTENGGTMPA